MSGIHVKFEVSPDQFLFDLTQASYEIFLKHGFDAPFIQIELDLCEAIRKVIQKDMMASTACGQPGCLKKDHHEISSREITELI